MACPVLGAANPQASSNNKSHDAAHLNNLGVAYMNQQLFEKALRAFQNAAALDPGLQIAQLNQGIALLNLGKVDTARPLLEAVKAIPGDAHAWYNLGLLDKNTGNAHGAIEDFRHVTEIDSNDADTWYFLGTSYSEDKQYAEAMDAFQYALKLLPTHASAEFGLARAYQLSGDSAQARSHLERFQHIKDAKLGLPISLAYGEQGKYSLAEESPEAPEKVPPTIKVRFRNVTAEAGLITIPSSPEGITFTSGFGPGACFLDYDNDGRIDIFLPNEGKEGGMSLYHNLGNGKFEDVTKRAGLDPRVHGIGCTAADYDNDGFTDLAVGIGDSVLLLHNEKNGTFRDVTRASGIKANAGVFSLLFVDYDHDGDLDLYLTEGSWKNVEDLLTGGTGEAARKKLHLASQSVPENQLWRNNGNGTFTDVTPQTNLSAIGSYTAALGIDYNNDRAVDIAATGWRGATAIFENPREGKFIAHPFPNPSADGVAVTALDFEHDGWMGVAFSHGVGSPANVALWRNKHGKSFETVPLPATNWVRGWGVAALDYDNDGWVDLVAVGETKDGRGEVRLFRNLGPDGFKDVTADVGLDKIALQEPRAIITGDYDNDGATDLLITQNHGPAVLLRNEGGSQNHWLRLNLRGLADNKSAIGTKVEVFSGGNRQKFEIAGSSGYLGQNSPYLTVGLGAAKQAEIVRMTWPTGVVQDETEVAGDREQKYLEIDRRGGSCPTLFVWNGKHYALVADMIGAGALGHWYRAGQRNIARPTEYIKIDRASIREKDGKLSFRFMEPLEESVYLDQAALLAVDHPSELDVFPNEYFATDPPYPPFKVIFSHDPRPPTGAWDEHGHDLLPGLLAHRYVGDFELLPFEGFAKLHTLELDLGEAYGGGPLWLLMHGEVEYYSATAMYAANQAGIGVIAPYVEALNTVGKWIRVDDDFGFPAGGPRTITADLTGKLPRGTRRIRISTNAQVYWDSILIDRAEQNQESHNHWVPLVRAELGFHGFPLKIEGKPSGNVQYIYEQASATGPYTHPAGNYTRYGDVLPLVKDFDDKLVVFGSGEEVALDFDPSGLPALPSGWTRDYFFLANGYEKDMDFYSYDWTHVDPLPFRDMRSYPYPGEAFPADEDHVKYLLEYNTRYMSGNEPAGYSFAYGSAK